MGGELLGVLFGLASAAVWGSADFCGGLAARHNRLTAVLLFSQLAGTLMLAVPLWLWREPLPAAADLLWGAAGGVCGMCGIPIFYAGLARGRMGVVAPVSAVVTAAVPVAVGVLLEGMPPVLKAAGFGLGVAAIWLVSRSDEGGGPVRPAELGPPAAAGLAFAGFFIFLDQAADAAVLWPLVAARLASLALILSAAGLRRRPLLPAAGHLPLIVLTGLMDTGGNILYVLAARHGRLDIAAVLAALYPASTVLLARLVLQEQIGRLQWWGILAALAAVVLIAA